MSWLDAWERRGREAMGMPLATTPRIAEPAVKPEMHTTWAQVRYADSQIGDPGEIIDVHYIVEDNRLTLTESNGIPTRHSSRLQSNETAVQVAKRMALADWRSSEKPFNRTLRYRPLGVA